MLTYNFELSHWAIDTKHKASVTILGYVENCIQPVYIVDDDENIYMISEDDLIPYDKYWFDKEENLK